MDFEHVTPEDIIYKGKKIFKGNSFKAILPVIVLILLITVIPTLFYTVGPNEVGVVRRFGKFVRVTSPGLHFKLPFKLEKVNKVPVDRIDTEEFGYRTLVPGVKSIYSPKNYDDESLMLTGDLNILEVKWIVQFKRNDPVKYLFNIRDQRKTLRDISESVIRKIIGDYSFDEILTEKRLEINTLAQKKMQSLLDLYGSGVKIVTLKLQNVNPPKPVQPAFNEVNQAKQEREKMINQAWQIYNRQIPKAKGEAKKIVSEAEGYANETVNRAQGDAVRFEEVLLAYEKAKDVTLERMYIDKMKDIFKKAGRVYIIDPKEKGLLPLLNLNKNE